MAMNEKLLIVDDDKGLLKVYEKVFKLNNFLYSVSFKKINASTVI